MLLWELEDWLTEFGDQVVKKKAVQGFDALTATKRSVYEVWLFDTEARNGGVLQYFCNRAERWEALLNIADDPMLPSLGDFAGQINVLISGIEAEAGADPWAVSLRRLGVGWVVAVIGTLVSLALGLVYRPPKHDTGDAANDT